MQAGEVPQGFEFRPTHSSIAKKSLCCAGMFPMFFAVTGMFVHSSTAAQKQGLRIPPDRKNVINCVRRKTNQGAKEKFLFFR